MKRLVNQFDSEATRITASTPRCGGCCSCCCCCCVIGLITVTSITSQNNLELLETKDIEEAQALKKRNNIAYGLLPVFLILEFIMWLAIGNATTFFMLAMTPIIACCMIIVPVVIKVKEQKVRESIGLRRRDSLKPSTMSELMERQRSPTATTSEQQEEHLESLSSVESIYPEEHHSGFVLSIIAACLTLIEALYS
nr:hypothetical protein [Candidatus Sigynarchaeota archaeon]